MYHTIRCMLSNTSGAMLESVPAAMPAEPASPKKDGREPSIPPPPPSRPPARLPDAASTLVGEERLPLRHQKMTPGLIDLFFHITLHSVVASQTCQKMEFEPVATPPHPPRPRPPERGQRAPPAAAAAAAATTNSRGRSPSACMLLLLPYDVHKDGR